MRAVMREVPQSWLDERARMGLDRFDEMWKGVLHMVPAPGFLHQKVAVEVIAFLKPMLARRGLETMYETEIHLPGSSNSDYRIPDMVFFHADRTEMITPRGLEGAPLAVLEIRSPDDETYDKFDFWASLGVPELIVLEPVGRKAEVYRLAGSRYLATSADGAGRVHAAGIDVRFSTVGDATTPRLRVECAGETCEI
jgi:Uma2 family endonuclease